MPGHTPKHEITLTAIRRLLEDRLRKYIGDDQGVLDNYSKCFFGEETRAEKSSKELIDKIVKWKKWDQETTKFLSVNESKWKTKIKELSYREALIEFLVALHGFWLFLWNDNQGCFEFVGFKEQGKNTNVAEYIHFGDGINYIKTTKGSGDIESIRKEMIANFLPRAGQGTVGLAFRAGCGVCLRDTVLDLRGAVPFEDYVLRNMSYSGVSIFMDDDDKNHEEGGTWQKDSATYPIAHFGVFFPCRGAWHSDAQPCAYHNAGSSKCFARMLQAFVDDQASDFIKNTYDYTVKKAFTDMARLMASDRTLQKQTEDRLREGGDARIQGLDALFRRIASFDETGKSDEKIDKDKDVEKNRWNTKMVSSIGCFMKTANDSQPSGMLYCNPGVNTVSELNYYAGEVFSNWFQRTHGQEITGIDTEFLNWLDPDDTSSCKEDENYEPPLIWKYFGAKVKSLGYDIVFVKVNHHHSQRPYVLALLANEAAAAFLGKPANLSRLKTFWEWALVAAEGHEYSYFPARRQGISRGIADKIEFEKRRAYRLDYLSRWFWKWLEKPLNCNARKDTPINKNIIGEWIEEESMQALRRKCLDPIAEGMKRWKKTGKEKKRIHGMFLLQPEYAKWECANSNQTSLSPLMARVYKELGFRYTKGDNKTPFLNADAIAQNLGTRDTFNRLVQVLEPWLRLLKKEDVLRVKPYEHTVCPSMLRSDISFKNENLDTWYSTQTSLSVPDIMRLWENNLGMDSCESSDAYNTITMNIQEDDSISVRLESKDQRLEPIVIRINTESSDSSWPYAPAHFTLSTDLENTLKMPVENRQACEGLEGTINSIITILNEIETGAASLFEFAALMDEPYRFLGTSSEDRGHKITHYLEKIVERPVAEKSPSLDGYGLRHHLLSPLYFNKQVVGFLIFSSGRPEYDSLDRMKLGQDRLEAIKYVRDLLKSYLYLALEKEDSITSIRNTSAAFAHELKNRMQSVMLQKNALKTINVIAADMLDKVHDTIVLIDLVNRGIPIREYAKKSSSFAFQQSDDIFESIKTCWLSALKEDDYIVLCKRKASNLWSDFNPEYVVLPEHKCTGQISTILWETIFLELIRNAMKYGDWIYNKGTSYKPRGSRKPLELVMNYDNKRDIAKISVSNSVWLGNEKERKIDRNNGIDPEEQDRSDWSPLITSTKTGTTILKQLVEVNLKQGKVTYPDLLSNISNVYACDIIFETI